MKRALALDWFGLDGQTLYRTLHDDAGLDAWMSRLTGYYQDWQNQGLLTMMLRLLTRENVSGRLAQDRAAERRLSNLYHLLELLQQTAMDEHLGVNKTLDWLRSAIVNAAGGSAGADEQQLRLESDADAVQIVTMHRSKGLEYPVVFCPVPWQRSNRLFSERDRVVCHEQGRMVVDLGSSDFEKRREQAIREELAEDLRLLYVALTRARYRCYLAWADVRGKETPNRSALAWLLEFETKDFDAQTETFLDFVRRAPTVFGYLLLEVPVEARGIYRRQTATAQLTARARQRSLYTDWQMSSYTALSSLSLHDEPELPQDKARESEPVAAQSDGDLPKGIAFGNAVHDLLEHHDFQVLAQSGTIADQRESVCRRYGLRLEQPELLDSLLQAAVSSPLAPDDPDFCLMHLSPGQCLKEMPFYLAMASLNVVAINDILDDTPVFQPFTGKWMQGYLTGFIDLVCEHGGRFYVMDYKTNALPDYGPASLTEAMREHNYGLQYWLYALVLHRYLQKRVPHYDYEQHFGGVRYLFVRGMHPDAPMRGVYSDQPELARIEALAALFDG